MIDWNKLRDHIPTIATSLGQLMVKDGLTGMIDMGITDLVMPSVSITYRIPGGEPFKVTLSIEKTN
jgi:hypothetical protein